MLPANTIQVGLITTAGKWDGERMCKVDSLDARQLWACILHSCCSNQFEKAEGMRLGGGGGGGRGDGC